MKNERKNGALDKAFHIIFLISACIAIIAVFSITIFIFAKGVQPFVPGNQEGNYSLWDFLTGTYWKPSNGV